MIKETIIELVDYNVLMSLVSYFKEKFSNIKVHGREATVVQSYSDRHNTYITPSLSVELLRRNTKSIGFGSFLYSVNEDDKILEFEGALLEYMVQLNVYSNTRGENHKWCSILDDILKEGEQGIPLNTYYDNGTIKQSNVGVLDYSFDNSVRNNNQIPNVITSDFHTIYDVKMIVLQQYKIVYDTTELGDIIGEKQ